MKPIISAFLLLAFSLYWIATVIFTLPDNYINITMYEANQNFQNVFFQRWGFFAPPPNYDDRVYYKFVDKIDSSKIFTFEVIEPLNKKNYEKNFFNWETDIIDYVLSNSVSSLAESMQSIQEIQKLDESENSVLPDSIYTNLAERVISRSA